MGLKVDVLSPVPQLHVPAPEASATRKPQLVSRLHNSVISRVASANFSTEVVIVKELGGVNMLSVWFSHARNSWVGVRPEVLVPPI